MEQEVFKGSDNLIRTVTLKTQAGIRRRSVQKLYLLDEAQCKEVQSEDNKSKELQVEELSSQSVVDRSNLDTSCQGGEDVRFSCYGRKLKLRNKKQ